jgi:hypothetical protein
MSHLAWFFDTALLYNDQGVEIDVCTSTHIATFGCAVGCCWWCYICYLPAAPEETQEVKWVP